jgi:ketosteroid isomerase-like protein
MYHAIVRRKLRATFASLNARDYSAVVALFGREHVHSFPGAHALAGTRTTLEATRRWYERLERVLPNVQFEIQRIAVSGWPWHTTAAVEWTDSGTTADGQPFANQGVHVVTLSWGRVTRLQIYCDTSVLEEVCRQQAAQGIPEAAAAPIEG